MKVCGSCTFHLQNKPHKRIKATPHLLVTGSQLTLAFRWTTISAVDYTEFIYNILTQFSCLYDWAGIKNLRSKVLRVSAL